MLIAHLTTSRPAPNAVPLAAVPSFAPLSLLLCSSNTRIAGRVLFEPFGAFSILHWLASEGIDPEMACWLYCLRGLREVFAAEGPSEVSIIRAQ